MPRSHEKPWRGTPVGLTTSFHQTQLLSEGANLVVDSFSELRQLLESMVVTPNKSLDDLRKDDP